MTLKYVPLIIGLLCSLVANTETCEIVEEYKADPDVTYYNLTELVMAGMDNNVPLVKELIEKGCDINYNDIVCVVKVEGEPDEVYHNIPLIQMVASRGAEDVVNFLAKDPTFILDAVDSWNSTALHDTAAWHFPIAPGT